jgi:hypothetical protein
LHPIVKILIGAILVIGSVWWVLQGSLQYTGHSGLSDLRTVLNGIIPPLVFLMGIFIVWLELDELRIEKELRTEEEKPKRKK